MTWTNLILPILNLALTLLKFAQQRQLLQAGQDKAIAMAALQVLENTQNGKAIRESVRKLSDTEATTLWDEMLDA